MAKNCVGIDIGACGLKLAVCSGGEVQRMVVADMPDNLVRDGRVVSSEATAQFIKETLKKEKISSKSCAVILPSSVAFVRTMVMPAMSHEHLVLNLPYEFRDFITQDKDKYFYDYAVLGRVDGEDDAPKQFELIAATTLKETIDDYTVMCRRAGLKLITAVPEELAYMNLIRAYQSRQGADLAEREYGFIDLGHTDSRLHIFRGVKHQATRVIEYGLQLLDAAISDQFNVDEHIARTYKHANNHNELGSEAAMSFYATVALEIMRAINFYRFNSPDSDLQDIFLCGGGTKIDLLVKQIQSELPVNIHSVAELLPDSATGHLDAALCHTAIGVTMQ